jgi:glutamate-1-semialdehyde 2,1-aminomutase
MQNNWLERSRKVLLDGCSTFSKRVDAYVENVYASHVLSGDGSYLTMCDGTRLLDTVGGLGSNLLKRHNNYSMEPIETILLAESLLKRIPYHHKLKYTMNGSDACSAAVRYARAYTGREQVYYSGYHGADNVFISSTPPAAGCVQEKCHKFETMDKLIEYAESGAKAAAYIVEPLELETPGLRERLVALRKACDKSKSLLVYDEVITGWRVPKFTVGNWMGIHPDITVMGKAIGGGYPLAVVLVTDEIASHTPGVFISHTFAANQCSLTHALHTVFTVTEDMIDEAWGAGEIFKNQANSIDPGLFQLKGYPTRFVWECPTDTAKALLWQEMYKRGILVGAAFFPCLEWSYIEYNIILAKLENSVAAIRKGAVLEGIPARPAFKRT